MGLFGTDADAKDRERWGRLAEQVANGLRTFKILGAALKEIRDQQLYRFEFATFEDCCSAKWKITARHASNLIAAFETAAVLGTVVPESVSERQLRPLGALPIDERRDAYEEALADGGTTQAIERAVRRRRPKKKAAPLKPIRFKLPGCSVVIMPNKSFHGIDATMKYLTEAVAVKFRDAA